MCSGVPFFFFFYLIFLKIYFGCVGSSLRCAGFSLRWLLLLWSAGSRAQAQQLWRPGPAAPRHAGSSRTRDRTRVPRLGRRILNHCTTRKDLPFCFNLHFLDYIWGTTSFCMLICHLYTFGEVSIKVIGLCFNQVLVFFLLLYNI